MIKNNFTTTLRQLWRQRLFTLLNIFGLAISISACWIIFRIVINEFSYEKNLPARENIYRVITGFVFDEKESYNGGASKPVYQGVREQIDGLKYVVPVFGQWVNTVEVNTSSGKPLFIDDPKNIVATDSVYFTMLPYRWLIGSKSTALSAQGNVVLTESRAKQYFPGIAFEKITGSQITYYSSRDTVQRTVTGIVADYPMPTEFTAQEFFPLPDKAYEAAAWTNTNGTDRLYLQLEKGTKPDLIVKQIDNITSQKRKAFHQNGIDNPKYKQWYRLLPLDESHFSTYINEYEVRKANKSVLLGLVGIASFLLLLACINYINMSVAQIPQRSKEIGVRKTLGGSQYQLISQFLRETVFTSFMAILLAFFLGKLGFGILKNIIPDGITPFGNFYQLALFTFALLVIITLLAGIYPGWLITKVKTINVFRNISLNQKRRRGLGLQKALTVFQFVIALVFITCALIGGNQLNYLLKSDLGFNKDAVVLVNVPWKYSFNAKYKDKQFVLRDELKKITGIRNIALGTEPMSNGYSSSPYEYAEEGKLPITHQVFKKWVDTAYLNLYELKLLAGRNLLPSDTTKEFVINEAAMHAFGFKSPQDALGKFIGQKGGEKFPVVGVISDFHSQSFYRAIDPLTLESEKDNLNTFDIKLDSRFAEQWPSILKEVEKKWYEFYPPETFSYKFYDETLAAMYKQERNLATLINVATAIAIFISCLGLFGLITLTAFQRTKEIGIRKVLGASVAGIVQLLSKEYVLLVIIAVMIASPMTWWVMNKWLEKFAYRIEIQWWMFAAAGIVAIMIALITLSFQSIKAAVANPVKSLRTE